MIDPDPNCIPALLNHTTIYNNLASVLAHIPFAPYWDSVARYEQSLTWYKEAVSMPLRFDRLEKRQTLTEAELALLRGQLDRVGIPSR